MKIQLHINLLTKQTKHNQILHILKVCLVFFVIYIQCFDILISLKNSSVLISLSNVFT